MESILYYAARLRLQFMIFSVVAQAQKLHRLCRCEDTGFTLKWSSVSCSHSKANVENCYKLHYNRITGNEGLSVNIWSPIRKWHALQWHDRNKDENGTFEYKFLRDTEHDVRVSR